MNLRMVPDRDLLPFCTGFGENSEQASWLLYKVFHSKGCGLGTFNFFLVFVAKT